MSSQDDLPPDLIAAERERQHVVAALGRIPLPSWTDGAGVVHRADSGRTAEHDVQEPRLWKRAQELSAQVAEHDYWKTYPPDQRLAQRMRLRKVASEQT